MQYQYFHKYLIFLIKVPLIFLGEKLSNNKDWIVHFFKGKKEESQEEMPFASGNIARAD